MISVKELRPGNLVKDKAGDIWRVGCVTGMRNESGSLILEREVDDGIMKWYSGEDDVIPIEIMIIYLILSISSVIRGGMYIEATEYL